MQMHSQVALRSESGSECLINVRLYRLVSRIISNFIERDVSAAKRLYSVGAKADFLFARDNLPAISLYSTLILGCIAKSLVYLIFPLRDGRLRSLRN